MAHRKGLQAGNVRSSPNVVCAQQLGHAGVATRKVRSMKVRQISNRTAARKDQKGGQHQTGLPEKDETPSDALAYAIHASKAASAAMAVPITTSIVIASLS